MSNPKQALVLREELVMLLAKGAIQEVDVGDCKVGVFSHYLLVAKQDGGLCPILDNRGLNCYLWPLKCKMLMVLRFGFESRSSSSAPASLASPWHSEPSPGVCTPPSLL